MPIVSTGYDMAYVDDIDILTSLDSRTTSNSRRGVENMSESEESKAIVGFWGFMYPVDRLLLSSQTIPLRG